ncbi:MAG: type II toxin-antitoxin system VapC family toxin [Nanoarchaeota archaeon]|nr:type II toxin-antitoxin system VapC family toxin [Nanoarchaeota archaeon]
MVRKICLDSDVIIELLRNNEQTKLTMSALDAEFYTTSINIFELWSGRKEKEENIIKDLLSWLNVKDLTKEVACKAGDIRIKLRKQGLDIEFRDIFIAAICIDNELELLTYNKKHFERMKQSGLKLIE